MDNSVALSHISLHDSSGAEKTTSRLSSLRTIGAYPMSVVFRVLRMLRTGLFTVLAFVFSGGRCAHVEERPNDPLPASNGRPDTMAVPNVELYPISGMTCTSHPATTSRPGLATKAVASRAQTRAARRGLREGSFRGNSDEKRTPTLKGVDSRLAQVILNDIVYGGPEVLFSDIAGQELAKQVLTETVVLPVDQPQLFTGLRAPPKGVLLFGPPGSGKAMLAKAVAHASRSTLLHVRAPSLISKGVAEGEQLVHVLFSVARAVQPSIIFVDEVHCLLSERKNSEHEAVWRLRKMFFAEFDGLDPEGDERIFVIVATDRPQALEDAALRRFTKRLYVKLPDEHARLVLIQQLLKNQNSRLPIEKLKYLAKVTSGYSVGDLAALAKDAALGSIRELTREQQQRIEPEKMRPINLEDFMQPLEKIHCSVSPDSLDLYEKWNQEFGDISI
ncbi:hypothetical protein MRX96_009956 [Rhipicephalus microplus]